MANIQGLSQAIVNALAEYTDEVIQGIEQEKKTVAEKAVETLRETSPKNTGKYAKGWAISNANGKYVVYNKTSYQLTHLLEYGHVKRNGGRTESRPHIRLAEEKAINDFTDAVKKVIQG